MNLFYYPFSSFSILKTNCIISTIRTYIYIIIFHPYLYLFFSILEPQLKYSKYSKLTTTAFAKFHVIMSWLDEVQLLVQELANFSCKGPNSKYFQLCGSYSLCCNDSVLPLLQIISHRQYMQTEHGSVPVKLYLQKTGGSCLTSGAVDCWLLI